jgi:hypothetical protein
LLAGFLGALALNCVELPDKLYSCSSDADCVALGNGAPYVCGAERWCVPPGQDGGLPPEDGGSDAGVTDGGTRPEDGGSDAGVTDGGQEPDGGEEPDGGPGTRCEPLPPRCLGDAGWCWDNPLSQGLDLHKVRGRSTRDVWAVGDMGVALHWNGSCWARFDTGSDKSLRALWPAPDGTWLAAGESGSLLLWDRSRWVAQPSLGSATLHDIAGVGTSVYAVGEGATLLAFNGQQWLPEAVDAGNGASPTLYAVWSNADNEAWAVGEGATILRRDGGSWGRVPAQNLDPAITLRGVAGRPTGTAVAVGQAVRVDWNRTFWSASSYDATLSPFLNDVWHEPQGGHTWVASSSSYVYNLDGPREPAGTSQTLNSVWGLGQDAWAVGRAGTLVQRRNFEWGEVPGGVAQNINGFWGVTEDELWAVGDGSLIMSRTDAGWSRLPSSAMPAELSPSYKAVWKSGDLLLVVGAGGKVYARENGQWSTDLAVTGKELRAIWGTAPDRVWVVGDSGLIRRRSSPGVWVVEDLTTPATLHAVWGSSEDNVWVAGASRTVYHRTPSLGWRVIPPGSLSAADLVGVWATAPNDVWVVQANGQLYRYNGVDWAPSLIQSTPLRAIAGRSANEVWTVGSQGTVWFWNGTAWARQTSLPDEQFRALWVTPTSVWAGGTNGNVLRLR